LHAAGSLSVRNGEADPLITKALSPQFQLWIGPHQLEVILSDCEKDDGPCVMTTGVPMMPGLSARC